MVFDAHSPDVRAELGGIVMVSLSFSGKAPQIGLCVKMRVECIDLLN